MSMSKLNSCPRLGTRAAGLCVVDNPLILKSSADIACRDCREDHGTNFYSRHKPGAPCSHTGLTSERTSLRLSWFKFHTSLLWVLLVFGNSIVNPEEGSFNVIRAALNRTLDELFAPAKAEGRAA
jgi:hypothetical protein